MKNNIIFKNIQDIEKYMPGCITLSLPGKPLIGKDRYSKIYHTTSLNSFMLIWAKKEIEICPINRSERYEGDGVINKSRESSIITNVIRDA
ncbi:MAG: hypothetical protein ACLRR1_11385 [Alistipes shahii]|uniref:hypothetical protein n=1 Tax=Alistipes shahii TaxID=328814 RepID=UPI00399066F7